MSSSWKGLVSSVSSLPELSTQEINISIAQNEKKHLKNYFWTNINYQEGFFKKYYLIYLITYQENYNYHFIGMQYGVLNFLYSNVHWPDGEP